MTESNSKKFLVLYLVTRLVLPPASVLMIIFACSLIHCPQAACIFCSAGCLIAGSVFAQSSITDEGTVSQKLIIQTSCER